MGYLPLFGDDAIQSYNKTHNRGLTNGRISSHFL